MSGHGLRYDLYGKQKNPTDRRAFGGSSGATKMQTQTIFKGIKARCIRLNISLSEASRQMDMAQGELNWLRTGEHGITKQTAAKIAAWLQKTKQHTALPPGQTVREG